MLSLFRCVLALGCLLVIFYIWGSALSNKLILKENHLPATVLVGFFAYFIVMEILFLPIVFAWNSLRLFIVVKYNYLLPKNICKKHTKVNLKVISISPDN